MKVENLKAGVVYWWNYEDESNRFYNPKKYYLGMVHKDGAHNLKEYIISKKLMKPKKN